MNDFAGALPADKRDGTGTMAAAIHQGVRAAIATSTTYGLLSAPVRVTDNTRSPPGQMTIFSETSSTEGFPLHGHLQLCTRICAR